MTFEQVTGMLGEHEHDKMLATLIMTAILTMTQMAAAPQRRRIYPLFQVSQVDIFNDILLDIRSCNTYLYISKPV